MYCTSELSVTVVMSSWGHEKVGAGATWDVEAGAVMLPTDTEMVPGADVVIAEGGPLEVGIAMEGVLTPEGIT